MSGAEGLVIEITPEILLRAYAIGIFPMANSEDDPGIFWVEPEFRGILPLERFHISRSLQKVLKKQPFEVRFDGDFHATLAGCAQAVSNRPTTWINSQIKELYLELHKMGHAHSVECWHEGQLVGGLYGVRLGSAFFGESMFSRQTNASKIALVHLVYEMKRAGFRLLDTQFTTKHLEQFGVIEIPQKQYLTLLDEALKTECQFLEGAGGATADSILQSVNQIS